MLSPVQADLYARKSTEDRGRSVASQELDFRADCAEQSLSVGRIFADPDRSASRHAKRPRPDYNALIEHIESGNCQLLTLWEASRGSRDLGEWDAFLKLCRSHRVLIRVISHRRTYDVTNRRDWRTLIDEGVDSADESERIAERTQRGKRIAAQEGRPCARLAYGFTRVYDERGRYVRQVANPVQAEIVRQIVEWAALGRPSSDIAKDLNDRGIPAPLGGQWGGAQVRQLAIKPSYAGLRVHRGGIVGKGAWEPIVDPVVWRAAHARLTQPGRKVGDSRLVYWLTGAVACGLCGGLLGSVRRRGTGMPAYVCKRCKRVSASSAMLEPPIERAILGWLRSPASAAIFEARADDAAVRAAMAEEASLRAQLDDCYDQAAKPGGLSPTGLVAMEARLLPLIAAAAEKVRRLSLPPALGGLAPVDVAARWGGLPVVSRRDVARAVATLVLSPGDRSGRRTFDVRRLARSRWTGDHRTWGEIADGVR